MRVLIIDDDADIRYIATRALGEIGGCDVLSAATGAAGIALARNDPPDVILLDLTLDREDGAAVLAQLHGDPETADIPVLLLTARSHDASIEALLGAGAHGFIPKPFHPATLSSTIEQLIGAKSES